MHGDLLHAFAVNRLGEVDAAVREAFLELGEQLRFVGAGRVHFVDEDECGHLIAIEQSPQRFGMALDAVRAGDDEDGVVEHGERTFRFGGEVDVSRSIEQGDGEVGRGDDGRLGEDGDAALPFHGVRVEEGVAMVDTSEFAHLASGIKQGFRQRGLACVHMRQNARDDSLHGLLPYLAVQ